MDEILTHVLATGLSMSPVVMILTEAVKQTKLIPSNLFPIVSVTVGTILGAILGMCFNQTIAEMAIGGLVAGGMACGLYDATNKYNDRSGKNKPDADDQENNIQ